SSLHRNPKLSLKKARWSSALPTAGCRNDINKSVEIWPGDDSRSAPRPTLRGAFPMPERRTVVRLVFTLGIIAGFTASVFAQGHKMGPLAQRASAKTSGFSQVIISAVDDSSLPEVAEAVQQRGGS